MDCQGDIYTIIHKSPCRIGNPLVVMPHLFVRLQDSAHKLRKNIFCLFPRLTSGWTNREAYSAPKVILVIPWGGAAQTPHDHVVAGVVPWVLDGHVLKYLTIRTQNIVRPGPHLPPLFRHCPRSLISISRSPSQEEVCGDVLKPHHCLHHCNLPVVPGYRWNLLPPGTLTRRAHTAK